MNVKDSIRLIEYSSVFAGTGFLLLMIASADQINLQPGINLFVFTLAIVFSLIYLFRGNILNYLLQKSKYNKLFYTIMDKIQVSDNYSLEGMQQCILPAIGSHFSVEEFLKENRLKTIIGKRKIINYKVIGTYFLFTFLMILISKLLHVDGKSITFYLVLGYIMIGMYFLFNNSNVQEDSGDIIMAFRPEYLQLLGKHISWKNILDWEYQNNNEQKHNNSTITIYYENAINSCDSISLEMEQLNIDKIGLIMLLAMFKTTYGETIY